MKGAYIFVSFCPTLKPCSGGTVLQDDIQIDHMETIHGQRVFKGLYSLASLSVPWVATHSEKMKCWDVVLTTPIDATRDERYERELIEQVDPVQVKNHILHAVRQFDARLC